MVKRLFKMLENNLANIINNEILHRVVVSMSYIVIAYISTKLLALILKKIEEKLKNTEYIYNLAIILTIKQPISIFIWITCIFSILVYNNISLAFLFEARIIIISLVILWLLLRFISQYAKSIIQRKEKNKENIDYGGISFVKKITQIFVVLIVSLVCLSKLGVGMQSLLAVSGAGGLAIGFAAKDLLSNIFGGLMIFLDKPFNVGDWIASPDKDIEGDVEEIGWRQTRILTFAKYPIYVPNSVFSGIIIENKSRMKSRRINEKLSIRYLDVSKMNKIVDEVKDMLKNHSNINQRLTTIVCFDSVTTSNATLTLLVYTFANTIEWARYTEIKQDVLLKIINIIKNNGGELSYSVSEVIVRGTGEEDITPTLSLENDVF